MRRVFYRSLRTHRYQGCSCIRTQSRESWLRPPWGPCTCRSCRTHIRTWQTASVCLELNSRGSLSPTFGECNRTQGMKRLSLIADIPKRQVRQGQSVRTAAISPPSGLRRYSPTLSSSSWREESLGYFTCPTLTQGMPWDVFSSPPLVNRHAGHSLPRVRRLQQVLGRANLGWAAGDVSRRVATSRCR